MFRKLLVFLSFIQAGMSAPGFMSVENSSLDKSIVKLVKQNKVVGNGFFISVNEILVPKVLFKNCLKDYTTCSVDIELASKERAQINSITELVNSNNTLPDLAQDISLVQSEVLRNQLQKMKSSFYKVEVDVEGVPLPLTSEINQEQINEARLIAYLQFTPIRNQQFYEVARNNIQNKIDRTKQQHENLRPHTEKSSERNENALQICLLNDEVKLQMDQAEKQSAKNHICRTYLELQMRSMSYDIQEYEHAGVVLDNFSKTEDYSFDEFSKSLGLVKTKGLMTHPKLCRIYDNLPAGDMSQFPTQIAFTTDHDFVETFIGAPLVSTDGKVLGVFIKPSLQGFNPTEINQLYGADALFISAIMIKQALNP